MWAWRCMGRIGFTQPLLRRNGVLEPISWEEAIETISQRIMAAPEQFAIYGSGQWTIPEGYAANKFIKGGLGSNHIDPNARLCMASAVTGYLSVYGVDEPAGCYDDLDKCDVLIMWGNNMAEMHPVLFSRVIDRRTRGEKVTLIDLGTRRTRTTDFSDHYLEFRPHSDLAIMNGIAHLLIQENGFDAKFVEKILQLSPGTEGPPTPTAPLNGDAMSFDDYKAALEPYTPEHVEKLSGVPAEKIRMLADLFANKDLRITSTWCMGFNQHSRGTNANRLCHGIHLLSGHFGRPGDAPTSLTGQPSACGTAREVGTLCHFLPGGRLILNPEHRKESGETVESAGRPHQSEARTSHGADVGEILHPERPGRRYSDALGAGHQSRAVAAEPEQVLQSEGVGQPDKFLIVSDVYRTATTELADLVLPAAMWVEKNGMYGNSERRTQQWFRMVKPPGEARDDAWQMIAVARRLHDLGHPGMKDKDGKLPFHLQERQRRTSARVGMAALLRHERG